jgi:very-short-patch-repair endonuclease
VKFRRQQPIGPFVVDFYNSDYRLIIEVDGPIHNYQVEADKARQEMLEILGFTILHLKAEMVEMNLGAAMTLIRAKIRDFEQFSLPRMGEGQGGG